MTAPTTLPSYWLAACRRHYGLTAVRPKGMPKPAPQWCLKLWAEFDAWHAWFRGHKAGARPAVWTTVPQWAWQLERELAAKQRKPAPTPAPDTPPPPVSSWTLPGPLIETASDPDAANGKPGVGTIARIIVPGVCPLWECTPVNGQGRGLLAQIEGQDQLAIAYSLLETRMRPGDSLAVTGTLNVKINQEPYNLLRLGCNTVFFELNAQAGAVLDGRPLYGQPGWEPYGNIGKLDFQAMQDGWPHRYPNFGCYGDDKTELAVSLQDYFDYVPMVTDDGGETWHRAPGPQGRPGMFGVFSAEGMGDTDSWGAL